MGGRRWEVSCEQFYCERSGTHLVAEQTCSRWPNRWPYGIVGLEFLVIAERLVFTVSLLNITRVRNHSV